MRGLNGGSPLPQMSLQRRPLSSSLSEGVVDVLFQIDGSVAYTKKAQAAWRRGAVAGLAAADGVTADESAPKNEEHREAWCSGFASAQRAKPILRSLLREEGTRRVRSS